MAHYSRSINRSWGQLSCVGDNIIAVYVGFHKDFLTITCL